MSPCECCGCCCVQVMRTVDRIVALTDMAHDGHRSMMYFVGGPMCTTKGTPLHADITEGVNCAVALRKVDEGKVRTGVAQ